MGKKKDLKKAIKSLDSIKEDAKIKRYQIIEQLENVDTALSNEEYKEVLQKVIDVNLHPEESYGVTSLRLKDMVVHSDKPMVYDNLSYLTRLFAYRDYTFIDSGDIFLLDSENYGYLELIDIIIHISDKMKLLCSEVLTTSLHNIFSTHNRAEECFDKVEDSGRGCLAPRINKMDNGDTTTNATTINGLDETISYLINQDKLKNGKESDVIFFFINNICDAIHSYKDISDAINIFKKYAEDYNCIFICYIDTSEYLNIDFRSFVGMVRSINTFGYRLENNVDNSVFEERKDDSNELPAIKKPIDEYSEENHRMTYFKNFLNKNYEITGSKDDFVFTENLYTEYEISCEVNFEKPLRKQVIYKLIRACSGEKEVIRLSHSFVDTDGKKKHKMAFIGLKSR